METKFAFMAVYRFRSVLPSTLIPVIFVQTLVISDQLRPSSSLIRRTILSANPADSKEAGIGPKPFLGEVFPFLVGVSVLSASASASPSAAFFRPRLRGVAVAGAEVGCGSYAVLGCCIFRRRLYCLPLRLREARCLTGRSRP